MSRNDVFHAAGDHDPRLKETHQQAQQDLGFDIPVETVPLPSLGKAYPEDHPLHIRIYKKSQSSIAFTRDIDTKCGSKSQKYTFRTWTYLVAVPFSLACGRLSYCDTLYAIWCMYCHWFYRGYRDFTGYTRIFCRITTT